MAVNMMPGRIGNMPLSAENPLGLSWHDSALIPLLNPTNIMDYFSERSNPFFDRTCNNEVIRMQRLSMDQLQNMTGLEYILLHVQEPILYVIRKQHRHSPTHVTPLGDYYIIAGFVYQAPDLASVLNSRLLSAVHHLQTSFEEALNFSRYHPSKGYWWDFVNKIGPDRFNPSSGTQKNGQSTQQVPLKTKEDSTVFQCQRVEMLLADLLRQFPLPAAPQNTLNQQSNAVNVKLEHNADSKQQDVQQIESNNVQIKQEPEDSANTPSELTNGTVIPHMDIKEEIKQENMKPPLEKKARM